MGRCVSTLPAVRSAVPCATHRYPPDVSLGGVRGKRVVLRQSIFFWLLMHLGCGDQHTSAAVCVDGISTGRRDSPVPIGTPALLGLSAVVRVIAWVCAPITRLRTWLAMHAFRLLHHRSVHTPSALSAAECCSVAMMLYGTPHRSTAAFQRRTGIVRTLGIIQPPAVTAPPILTGPTAMPCISHYPPSA